MQAFHCLCLERAKGGPYCNHPDVVSALNAESAVQAYRLLATLITAGVSITYGSGTDIPKAVRCSKDLGCSRRTVPTQAQS